VVRNRASLRTNSVDDSFVDVENMTELGRCPFRLKLIAEYPPQREKVQIACGGFKFEHPSNHASSVNGRDALGQLNLVISTGIGGALGSVSFSISIVWRAGF
jgi:hypothetical protein